MKRAGGYLTVYLSLTLTLILSFLLTMLEGARRHTVRMEAECITDIGMNSVLAEFHRELLEQYDLLFVDMSYGTSRASIGNSSEHLRRYLQANCRQSSGDKGLFSARDWLALSVDRAVIGEYSLASDDGGNVMKRQALEYMKGASVEGIAADLLLRVNEVENLGLDTRDVAAERENIQAQIDAVELPKETDEEGEEYEIALDNPADGVNASRNSFTLGMVLGSGYRVSGAAVRLEQYLSHRERRCGTGNPAGSPQPEGLAENLLFDCYLFDKCGHYGKETDKSVLKYQIEYLLAGKGSDVENLENVVKRLLLWREVANVIYLLSDSAKCAEAEILALTLTAVFLVPELAEPVKYSILFAWAYVESLADMRALLNDGKVPLMKTGSEWKTSIKSLFGFTGGTVEGGTGGSGLAYGDYLRIMLYMEDGTKKNMRAMDLMEMDIRRTPGNAHFCMDACFDSYTADVSISSAYGYAYETRRHYGYDK